MTLFGNGTWSSSGSKSRNQSSSDCGRNAFDGNFAGAEPITLQPFPQYDLHTMCWAARTRENNDRRPSDR